MGEKFGRGEFGTCPRLGHSIFSNNYVTPRYLCGKPSVLPVGTSDKLGSATVAVYCSRCLDVYRPREVSAAAAAL